MDLAAIDALAAKYAGQPVDVLFNNAGITGGGDNQLFGKKMEWPLYELVLRTNVVGPLKMAEAFLPQRAGQPAEEDQQRVQQPGFDRQHEERHAVFLPVRARRHSTW